MLPLRERNLVQVLPFVHTYTEDGIIHLLVWLLWHFGP